MNIATLNEMAHSSVGIIVLAAGALLRLGTPKQSLIYEGKTLLRRAIESASDCACRPVIVVVGAHAEKLMNEAGDLPVKFIFNAEWEAGMSSSIRCGINAIESYSAQHTAIDAVVLMLCDQPLVTGSTIDSIVSAYRESGMSIIASEYGGSLGVPALFARKRFRELKALQGGQGAKKIILEHLPEVGRVPFEGGALDIDTQEDFARLRASNENRNEGF